MSEAQLPALPPLQGDLFLSVFTHKSLRMTDRSVDNERYAALGEKVLEATITYYIFFCNPKYDGKAIEAARLSLLSDDNYTTWANYYRLREKLRYNPSAFDKIYSFDGAREIFHAYVGGIYTQEDGPRTVDSWLLDLVASPEERMELQKNSSHHQQMSPDRSNSPPPAPQSYIDYYSTCSQFGTLSAPWASRQLGPDVPVYDAQPRRTLNSSLPPAPKTHTAYLPRFNEIATKRRLDVQWHAEKVGYDHSARWKVVCIVDGKPCGSGSATTKQLAKEEAAKQAIQILGISLL